MLIMRLWTLDWGYDHLRLRLWSLHWRRKIIPKPARPCSTCPFFYEISGTSWFFFFSGVIIASVEGDHSPSKVFIASWSTLFMHEILCMKMIIAMNCCCSCMIFWIMAMKDYWSWMISTDRCIISWPLPLIQYQMRTCTATPCRWHHCRQRSYPRSIGASHSKPKNPSHLILRWEDPRKLLS